MTGFIDQPGVKEKMRRGLKKTQISTAAPAISDAGALLARQAPEIQVMIDPQPSGLAAWLSMDPSILLWAAIVYAVLGSFLSYFVGRGLVRRNADRYAREAELRFALVRVSEHVDGITLAAGEADERRHLESLLDNVLVAMRRLVRGLTNLHWVTAGFGWITGIVPILVAAPLYFGGKTTFGGMMMAAAAFTQAEGSLRWFVDNFSRLADWRATLRRSRSSSPAPNPSSAASATRCAGTRPTPKMRRRKR